VADAASLAKGLADRLRPGIWKIAESSLRVVVCAANQARTLAASEPYASAVHTES
jgi:hypothetical protein